MFLKLKYALSVHNNALFYVKMALIIKIRVVCVI